MEGVTKRQVAHLKSVVDLTEVAQGLYSLPGAESSELRRAWRAVLLTGGESFLIRRSAARAWGFDGVGPLAEVEVGVPASQRPRSHPVVRVRNLVAGDLAECTGGMPVTAPARTLIDLAAVASADTVERALESALRRRLLDVDSLERRLQQGRPRGAATLRVVMSRRPPGCKPTESDAETIFLQIAREAGLPEPVRQHRLLLAGRWYRLDSAWPDVRLAAEVDGASVHGPDRFEGDIARQNRIVLDGWFVLRFTVRALLYERQRVKSELVRGWQIQTHRQF